MKKARTAAQLELEPVVSRFRKRRVGRPRSARPARCARSTDVLLARERLRRRTSTATGLEWMLRRVPARRSTAARGSSCRASRPNAQEVLPGGLAILLEVFDRLGIESMRMAEGALREGLLYDLLGRLTDEDARVRTVRAMEGALPRRDRAGRSRGSDGARVPAAGAGRLGARRSARRADAGAGRRACTRSGSTSRIRSYQRHGAYLLQNADLPGFPREEQQLLAALVGGAPAQAESGSGGRA